MSTYKFRQHVVNEFGFKVTKVETVHGELGSGIFDVTGKEIFEGDRVEFGCSKQGNIVFDDGRFCVTEGSTLYPLNDYPNFGIDGIRVIGHVEDEA